MAYNGETLGSTTHGLILPQMYLCVCHSFFMHATLHNIACSHFEHLVLEGFPHQSQGWVCFFTDSACSMMSLMVWAHGGTVPLLCKGLTHSQERCPCLEEALAARWALLPRTKHPPPNSSSKRGPSAGAEERETEEVRK